MCKNNNKYKSIIKFVCGFYKTFFFFFFLEEDGGLPTIVVGSSKVVVLDNYFIIVQFRPADMQVAPRESTW